MNQMNIGAMNPGNPAMGGMPMMNSGANGIQIRQPEEHEETNYESRLNYYIYGYFLEKGMWECARAMKDSGAQFEPNLVHGDADMNGAEEKPETKDGIAFKKPEDLPRLQASKEDQGGPFLLSWFELFWDVYWAQRRNSRATPVASSYVQLSQAQARRNDQAQQQMLRAMPGMMPGMDYQNQMMRQNQMMGAMNGDLRQRQAMQQNRLQPGQQQQMAQFIRQQQIQMSQNQMRRDGSEMNGQRQRSPSGGDHAPSPSKRQRLDGVPFNGGPMMPNGRGMPGGMPGQQMMQESQAQHTNQLLMNNGINPGPGMELGAAGAEFFANNPAAAAMQIRANAGIPPQPGGNGNGNHALQDYQMQLMLLEQQNKKRLLMARQEQDNITTRPEGQPGMPGQGGFAPVMSPSGSRGGPSPQPDQIRRGTPKMNQPGMPGSPMPDGRMTGSPAGINFNNMDPGVYNQLNPRMQPPPSSNPAFNGQFSNAQLEAMQRVTANGARMPNDNWPQGPPNQPPMVRNAQQPQPNQVETPQQRNNMPPPQVVPANNAANGRPASPPAAPPTPQPAKQANPKNKKDGKAKKPAKKNSTASVAVTPASEAENPPATTPSTPITPSHTTNPFGTKTEGQNPSVPIQNTTANAAPQLATPQQDANAAQTFPTLDGTDGGDYNMAFNNDLGDANVLENFDFDQFLSGDAFNFEGVGYDNTDGLEAGMGDA